MGVPLIVVFDRYFLHQRPVVLVLLVWVVLVLELLGLIVLLGLLLWQGPKQASPQKMVPLCLAQRFR